MPEEAALFLKSLEISGFKSFARATRFEFTPGITGFVGPNGSGKSNVVDAIRWCLGEQSIRDLRGQRAEDVIYAGSRHVLGVAEVSLTLAPSGDESGSEGDVTIARRLYRSGESEYLVDGRKARLRDLLDRLRSLGIDGSRHIVVTQGMADALLSAAPAERRSLLEQAAGLSGYRVRRDEARQKLGTTEQNVATIALVLEELEPRLRTLRRQARAVQDREEAQSLLQRRLHDWYASRWRAASSEAEERSAQTARALEDRRTSETRLIELENATEAVLQQEREWQQRIDMLVAANHALERDRDAAERGRADTEQKLTAARRQHASADARAARAQEAEAGAGQRIVEITELLRQAEADMTSLRADEEALGLRFTRAGQELQQADAERRRLQAEAVAQEQDSRAVMQRGDELQREIRKKAQRREDITRGVESARAAIRDGARESDELSAKRTVVATEVETLTAQLKEADEVATSWRVRSNRLDVLAARTRGAATNAQRRRDSAQRSLEALNDDGRGTLVHDIDVQRGWETAIAAALGAWAHAAVGGSAASTMHQDRVPGFAAWRATLDSVIEPGLWADSVVAGMPVGYVNPLRTVVLVETEHEAQQVWNALGALSAHTVNTPSVMVVTRMGTYWNAVGRAIAGGDDRAASYLRLKRETATMASRFTVLSARAARMDDARADAMTRRKTLEDQMSGLELELRRSRNQEAELANRLTRLQKDRIELETRAQSLDAELGWLDHTETTLRSEYERWEASTGERERATSDLTRRVDDAATQVEAIRSRVAELESQRRDARHAYDVATATHRAQQHLLTAIESERTRLQRELATGAAEKLELERTIERLQAELLSHQQQVERLDGLLQEHSASLEAARAARPTRPLPAEQLREVRATVLALVQRHERAQAESLGAQQRMDALRGEIRDDLQLMPEELRPAEEAPPSEAEVRRLRSRSMQYADADPSVVDEARELAERHSYLLKHVEDLKTAADTLRAMMEVADAEMRAQFDVAFVAVSEEFSRVFEVMLRGGRARLEQLDGGGIEVIAQLPGKRSRSSAAFSGGERSLIASSLLFGVLKMRPAPFCVLDEVDAALDEGNVDRYLAALRDISRKTQAVVVTHNRATMAAADVLYGLTMDAEGASGVLSLRLDTEAAG